jgi:nucleotide-binding universal stress UspA family protein
MINVFSRHEKSKEEPLSFKSLLVPVDGSEASMMAVEFACNIARRGRAKVHVVHVIEVRRALRLDADLTDEAQKGEEILTQAEMAARRQDYEVDGELLQARDAGHAIVDEAIERNADLIVIGVPYRRPFGEFELSRVPTQVMKTAPCEVVLLRMPAE